MTTPIMNPWMTYGFPLLIIVITLTLFHGGRAIKKWRRKRKAEVETL